MSASSTQAKPRILIASDDGALANRYALILADEFIVSVTDAAADSMLFIKQHFPQLIMIDPLLFNDHLKSTISGISTNSPLSRIVVIEDSADRSLDQMALFKTGAHGFFADDISASLLIKAIHSVSKGEVWVPRKLISRLISELARGKAAADSRQDLAARKTMAKLTPREFEVAQMVHLGGNNKMIARELDISERTVKAHLSAIFRKLNIANRLHLALFFNEIA
jgi:DNA-binding NarL/FixJ family response regulator